MIAQMLADTFRGSAAYKASESGLQTHCECLEIIMVGVNTMCKHMMGLNTICIMTLH